MSRTPTPRQNHLTTTHAAEQVRQRFVKPTTASYQATPQRPRTGPVRPNFAVSLIDLSRCRHLADRKSPTFILLPKDPKDAAKSAAVHEVLRLDLQERRRDRRRSSTTSRCPPACRTRCATAVAQKDPMADRQARLQVSLAAERGTARVAGRHPRIRNGPVQQILAATPETKPADGTGPEPRDVDRFGRGSTQSSPGWPPPPASSSWCCWARSSSCCSSAG